MGQQALVLNQVEEATKHFEEVVAIYPDIEGIHRALGMLYVQKKNYALAVQHLETSLLEEETFDTINNLGGAYVELGDYPNAEKHLQRALAMHPESPIAHKNLAVLFERTEDADRAVYHFEKYFDLQPNDLETMQTYAQYLIKIGRWNQAAAFLNELTQDVTDVAPLYFLLAQAEIQNERQEKAIEALQRGIQLIGPSLALEWMSRKEFNAVRNSQEFRKLVVRLKEASVSFEEN
jgi:tetratricopeptide (TPR) repeat protein